MVKMETETTTAKPGREWLNKERKELFDGVVAVIARDVYRLETKWTRDPRVVAGRTVLQPELRAALARVLRNVADRLNGE
jgi:hypothetical protein